MKKRLLSAALALAMVLTMLPLTAFAAAPGPAPGQNVAYQRNAATDGSGRTAGNWYWYDAAGKTYIPVTTGYITGTGDSGAWYNGAIGAGAAPKSGSFKLIGTGSIDFASMSGAVTVDTFGQSLTVGSLDAVNPTTTAVNTVSSLTITSTAAAKGTVTGSFATAKSFTLNLTNVTASSSAAAFTNANSGTIILDNAEMSAISMTGGTSGGRVELKNGAKVNGAVTINRTSGSGASVTLGGGSSVGGGITVSQTTGAGAALPNNTNQAQTGGTVNINGTATSVTGDITVTGNNSWVNVVDGKANGAITLNGVGGGVNVTSLGAVGSIALQSSGLTGADLTRSPGHTVNFTGNGTVGAIGNGTGGNQCTGVDKININGGGTVGTIVLGNADIVLNGSHITTIGALYKGSLSVTGAVGKRASIGTMTLGEASLGAADSLTVTTSGNNIELGNITRNGANPISITLTGQTDKLDENNNVYGQLPNDANTSIIITGGTFKPQPQEKNLRDLAYVVRHADGVGPWTYTNSIQQAAAYWQVLKGNAVVMQTNRIGSTKSSILFKIGDTDALLYYGVPGEPFVLPTSLGGKNNITNWYDEANKQSYTAGKGILMPADGTKLTLNAMDSGVTLTEITDITVTSHPGVRAELTDNGIRLTGAVAVGPTGSVNMTLDVTTNAGKGKSTLQVVYSAQIGSGSAWFVQPVADPNGLTLAGNGEILVCPGGKQYTLSTSLTRQSDSLRIATTGTKNDGEGITFLTATRVAVPGWTSTQNEELQGILTNTSGAKAEVKDSPAVQAALNALAGQLTGQTESLLNQARNQKWKDQGQTGTRPAANNMGITTLWIVPCVDMQVTNYSDSGKYGTMTFTLVPSYRLVAGGNSLTRAEAKGPYTKDDLQYEVRGITSLGALSGTPGTVEVNFGIKGTFALASAGATSYAHQGSTYVYEVTKSGSLLNFNVTHITAGGGLGSFIINQDDAPVKLTRKSPAAVTLRYDNLQTAVDETLPQTAGNEDVISVAGNYAGSSSLTVTGKARSFKIKADANAPKITFTNASGFTYSANGNQTEYDVKLEKTTTPVVPSGNVTIGVASVANGYARVSATSVKPGTAVTITAVPNTGYTATTPSVRYSTKSTTNNVLGVTAVGANTWSFTVPADATGVTVTPGFVRIATTNVPFTDVAANAWYYTGVEYCYNTIRGSSRLMQGMNDSNTIFSPDSGFTRAQVVQILWNIKGRPSPRNTYNRFSDISSVHYAYNAMLWAVQNGYTEGYPDGTFRPNQYVTRQEMAVFLWRAAGKPTNYSTVNLNNYNDGNQVYDWAQTAMKWAVATGTLSGQGSASVGRYLVPRAVAYRSEVAVTVMNFDKLAVFR